MSAPASARDRAEPLVRAIVSLHDAALRSRYVAAIARLWPTAALARVLDALCERAERAEPAAREVLVAVVDALNREEMSAIVQRLREEAAGESLLALERLIRQPAAAAAAVRAASATAPGERPADEAVRGAAGAGDSGRFLTLGQRKWLARRPDRGAVESLLRDPHPLVVAGCLDNPRVTEEDVVALVARRPGRGEVLAAVARSRWIHRPRVRLALVLNRATPIEIAVRISGLLLRTELQLVAQSPAAAPALRAVCLEHLERRPPFKLRRRVARGGVH